MKIIANFIFLFHIFNIIYSEPIWDISFYDEEDLNFTNPNKFTLLKGNYRTVRVRVISIQASENRSIHLNATLSLNHSDFKMLPDKININTEKSKDYEIEIGVPCNSELDSMELNFNFGDNSTMDLVDINNCEVTIKKVVKTISFDILNKENIAINLNSKLYIKQDFKNFEKLQIKISTGFECDIVGYLENIYMIIDEYNDGFKIFYSFLNPNFEIFTEKITDEKSCEISITITSTENSKCFTTDTGHTIIVYIQNERLDTGYKEAFYHNSIVSSYIDNYQEKDDNDEENSLSLNFFKEVFYFVSYCSIQDRDSELLTNNEILNQRLNKDNKNILASFTMQEFDKRIYEPTIIFKNLQKDKNYKIKCIFDFLDNKTNIELTYGEGMQIPIKINFNETKSISEKKCSNDEYKNNILDTRYCDVINHRLIFMLLHDLNKRYKLDNFIYEDFVKYSDKNNEGKIKHIKNINETMFSSKNDMLSILSDYLFIINCEEDEKCQEEKNMLFKNILIDYSEINNDDVNIISNEQFAINEVLLFNNIIENTDCINYDNFVFLVNNVFDKKDFFFQISNKEYNYYLTNYFLLIFDKLLSIITKFKSIYSDKFEIDKKFDIYKNEFLIKFYNYFVSWISHGMINREHILLDFCKNLYFNFIETPVKGNIRTIIDSESLKITGFDSKKSEKLYKDIYSVGAISYKKFPLFPLENEKLEAVTLFLFTDLRENFENKDISYKEAFKIIFKKKTKDNYCYLWNNDYYKEKDSINNFALTEYLNKDGNKYDINCISTIMISPMTIILGQNDIKGSLFVEGIGFISVFIIVLMILCLIIISSPFILKKYYSYQKAKNTLSS